MFGDHLGPVLKNSHFIEFVITKIVEFGILCIVITCLAPKFIFYVFQNGDGGHLGFRGQDVLKSKFNLFIGFVTLKIVAFSILYLHPYVYNLLSFEKDITFFSKWRWRPYRI